MSLTNCDRVSSGHASVEQSAPNRLLFVGTYSTLQGDCKTQRVEILPDSISMIKEDHPTNSAKFIRSQIVENRQMTKLFGPTSIAHLVSFGGERTLVWLVKPAEPAELSRIHFGAYALSEWPKGDLLEGVNLRDPAIEFALFPCPKVELGSE